MITSINEWHNLNENESKAIVRLRASGSIAAVKNSGEGNEYHLLREVILELTQRLNDVEAKVQELGGEETDR